MAVDKESIVPSWRYSLDICQYLGNQNNTIGMFPHIYFQGKFWLFWNAVASSDMLGYEKLGNKFLSWNILVPTILNKYSSFWFELPDQISVSSTYFTHSDTSSPQLFFCHQFFFQPPPFSLVVDCNLPFSLDIHGITRTD